MKCPMCNGNLKNVNKKEYVLGEYVGEYEFMVCDKCNESYSSSETTRKIEEDAKKKGLWGLNLKTKVTKTGNSMAIRVPKKIADFLKLNSGDEATMHPQGRRIIIDLV